MLSANLGSEVLASGDIMHHRLAKYCTPFAAAKAFPLPVLKVNIDVSRNIEDLKI